MELRKLTWAGVSYQTGHKDGEGNCAQFKSSIGIALDHSGDLFVCDSRNHCIRKVSGYDGTVSTFTSNIYGPKAILLRYETDT